MRETSGMFEMLCILICVFITYIKIHGVLHSRFMNFIYVKSQ